MTEHILFAAFTCPQCGEQLVGPSGNPEAQAYEIIRCPVHGDIGRLCDIQEQAADYAAREIGEAFMDIFEDAGFTVTKE